MPARIEGDPARGVSSRRSERPVLLSRQVRVHRRPHPYPGRPPKCWGGARRAQWLTSIVAVGAYHPSPKPHVPRSAGVRAESPKRVWVGLLSGWGSSDLYQTPRKAISAFWSRPPDVLLQYSVQIRSPVAPCRPGRHGGLGGVLISILG